MMLSNIIVCVFVAKLPLTFTYFHLVRDLVMLRKLIKYHKRRDALQHDTLLTFMHINNTRVGTHKCVTRLFTHLHIFHVMFEGNDDDYVDRKKN